MAQPGEVVSCLTTTGGELCPLGAVDCSIKTTSSICPPQAPLNTSTGMCEVPPICPSLYNYVNSADACQETVPPTCSSSSAVLNASVGMCQDNPLCKAGYTFDSSLNQCYEDTPYACPAGTTYNGAGKCSALPSCQEGTYNPATALCEVHQTASVICPSGTAFNPTSNRCEVVPTCSSGVYDPVQKLCVDTASPVCPAGSSFCPHLKNAKRLPFVPQVQEAMMQRKRNAFS